MATFRLTGLDETLGGIVDGPIHDIVPLSTSHRDMAAYAKAVAEKHGARLLNEGIIRGGGCWVLHIAGNAAAAWAIWDEMKCHIPCYLELTVIPLARAGTVDVGALATVITRMRAQRTEARAMRKELQHPPMGYSVAVWQAYLCSCTVAGAAELDADAWDSDMVADRRAAIEAGRCAIPARILRHAGQLYGDAR